MPQPARAVSLAVVAVLAVALCAGVVATLRPSADSPSSPPSSRPLMYGLTLDAVTDVEAITDYLDSLPGPRPVVRIVFDEGRTPESYAPAVATIAQHADVMGLVADSSIMARLSEQAHLERTRHYLEVLGDDVTIWEVGNEVNGEWAGDRREVARKVMAANALVRESGGRTALTLFYNPWCYRDAENLMTRWAREELTQAERDSVDQVLISYYPQECQGRFPESWDEVFDEVGELFPHALLGFGEVGLTSPVTPETQQEAERTMRYFYAQRPDHDRFIGGWFWWCARQDLVEPPHLMRQSYRDVLPSE
ncbi:MAG: hypothetical protein Q4G43_10170 [Mobilicoccus sp.]|nr:hypothetical protein [Mobilicoccus sp.]